jgi:hypothetical protein
MHLDFAMRSLKICHVVVFAARLAARLTTFFSMPYVGAGV